METVVAYSLTPEQVAAYRRDGYIVLPGVFSSAEVARMREAADDLLELLINASLAVGTTNPRLGLRARGDGKQSVLKVQPVNDASDYLRAVSEDARLLQPMRDLLRCEPILMEEKLLYKQPLPDPVPLATRPDDDAVALHHDWGAYRAQDYPQETLSSAITIDELTTENGTLRYFPGSHRIDFPLELNYTPLGDVEKIPEALRALGAASLDDAVPIVAPPGSVLIFHSMTLHYSGPNLTGQPRRVMIYSHYPEWYPSEPDKRNRPGRLRAQEHEQQYRQMVASGAFRDRWRAPGR
ncbi:MAG: phytanoyl-CoA dioxygenase family protein [Chloroflexi bacterium]|nr:phytanoyl-CoA dioxygenase family protein [Chloroflexota bacterium]